MNSSLWQLTILIRGGVSSPIAESIVDFDSYIEPQVNRQIKIIYQFVYTFVTHDRFELCPISEYHRSHGLKLNDNQQPLRQKYAALYDG